MAEKVSFNIASEASLVYTSSGQKFDKNAKILNIQMRHYEQFSNTVHKWQSWRNKNETSCIARVLNFNLAIKKRILQLSKLE